ncbi:DNA repair protein RecO [Picosynechococcus sp. PCC 73109]|uniref:DNA repair protein RecO n=1 Tax=Picosynechococcus sp. PCC 73109 TaxID=374982 RepID=UPI0007458A2E|nr:DNA repair protein RecO [Picosynechococcus sp. PCC 73109]AMA08533.1 DNA repair protein RecO [Picosynechococcus sp. PCC 73109]
MSFKVTGIILKGSPLGEADRLVTILSPEQGLVKAVAPGARQHRSALRGRTELLVVNEFVLTRGRSLDRIQQADMLTSYSGLRHDFAKLAVGQYLAEVTHYLAVSHTPQPELYELLREHLRRIEALEFQPSARVTQIIAHLTQALFHLLAIAGFAPQVQHCQGSQTLISPNFVDPRWRIGFSHDLGGIMVLSQGNIRPDQRLTALELDILQMLPNRNLPELQRWSQAEQMVFSLETAWLRVEHLLRQYLEHHIGKTLKAAPLIDTLAPLAF